MSKLPPRVGLTTYREQAIFGPWDESADLLPRSYADSVVAAGGAPVLLPPVTSDDLAPIAQSVLAGLHGLLLTGGADVDPTLYGATPDSRTDTPRTDRDAWESALIREAMRIDLPILGVCRGLQVLAVELGGSLSQHLPDVVGNDSHRPTTGEFARHGVVTAGSTRTAKILGPVLDVATHHHQAVDRLPDRAVATGWTADDTVEAFEVRGPTWVLAVQWHPEVHDGAPLFEAFVEAARKWRRKHRYVDEPIRFSAGKGKK